LYSSSNIIRVIKSKRMRWVWHVAHMGEMRNVCKSLVGKHEGKRPLGRPRHRWEYNIKIDISEIGFECVNWVHLAQDRGRWRGLVIEVMNLRVP
jgi:hypothetical protein